MQELTRKMAARIQDMAAAVKKDKTSAVVDKDMEIEVLKAEIGALNGKLAGTADSAGASDGKPQDPAQVEALSSALEVSHQKMVQAQQKAEALAEQVRALQLERDVVQEEQRIQSEELKIKRMRQVVGRLMSRSLATAFYSWSHMVDQDIDIQGLSQGEQAASSQGGAKVRAAGEDPPTGMTAPYSPRSSAPQDVQLFVEDILRRVESDVDKLMGTIDQISVSDSVCSLALRFCVRVSVCANHPEIRSPTHAHAEPFGFPPTLD